jgi:hypothetical protein
MSKQSQREINRVQKNAQKCQAKEEYIHQKYLFIKDYEFRNLKPDM